MFFIDIIIKKNFGTFNQRSKGKVRERCLSLVEQ